MARPRKPHGTQAAYRAHRREGTRICDACQAWKDARNAENPLKTPKPLPDAPDLANMVIQPERIAEIEARAAEIAAQKAAEVIANNPKSRSKRRIDPLAESFDNLDTVQAALDTALSDDIARVPALSKRKSELIAEIIALGGVVEAEEKVDKLGSLLDSATEVDRGDDNVIGFRKATA